MLTLAFNIQPVKARSDSTIGFYGMNYEVYRDSLVSYLKTLGYTVFAVDELNFTYADTVYLDYRNVYPLTEEDLLDYVENGGSLWVGGEACGGAFLGVTISTNSIWFVGSLSDPRVWIIEHPVLQDVRSIAYPAGAWLEITGNIQGIMRIDGKTMLAAKFLEHGKILWLIDSDIFGDYFLDDEDNRILARNIAAWLTPRTWIVDDDGPADFHTIQEAINAANDGDTVFVRNGTYYEHVVIDKSLTLEGENRASTIIDAEYTEPRVVLVTADNVKISGFTIQHVMVGGSAIVLDNYVNMTFSDNIITGNSEGIRILHSSGNIISHNIIQDCYYNTGLGFNWAYNNIVYGNIIENNNVGIGGNFWNSTFFENVIRDNRGGWAGWGISDNFQDCIFFHNNIINNGDQVYNTNSNPNLWDNGYPSGGNYWSDYIGIDSCNGPNQNLTGSDGMGDAPYVIDLNNQDNYPLMRPYVPFENQTIYIRADGSIDPSGAPIYQTGDLYTLTDNITSVSNGVVIERDNMTLDGADYTIQGTQFVVTKGIDLIGRSNVTVENTDITVFAYGIYLSSSSNNSISRNSITNCNSGIWFQESQDNSITRNEITNCLLTSGITFSGSSNNSVFENKITSNIVGIRIYASSNNTISMNTITNNLDLGIGLYSTSNGNTISENNVTANNAGIVVFWSSDNYVFHNNFIDNRQQLWVGGLSKNSLDDGYPSGGNYWSDYTGVDVKSGLNQNLSGSDGIGDTPYVIDTDNIDHYPLIIPFGASPPPTYSLTIIITVGGTTNPVSGTYSYTANSAFEVSAIPNVNYLFDHWELDSLNVGSANPYTVLMNKNHTLKAVFSPIPSPKPVGGYSIQIEATITTKPLTLYLALATILVIGFTTIKRKTTRKIKIVIPS
jgi:parallel beta-helix repeat protein